MKSAFAVSFDSVCVECRELKRLGIQRKYFKCTFCEEWKIYHQKLEVPENENHKNSVSDCSNHHNNSSQ